ncbi:MAG: hypothetical protein ACRC2U_19735, partial [Aeromonas sp.]
FYRCPLLNRMATDSTGRELDVYRGGYTMNSKMHFAIPGAIDTGPTSAYSSASNGGKAHPISRYTTPSRTVALLMGYDDGNYRPNVDGTQPDQKSWRTVDSNGSNPQENSNLIPHHKRVGAQSDGIGGSSGVYTFLDGSTRKLTPEEAAEYLKRL